jgi:predicted component of type VI protein secretion system
MPAQLLALTKGPSILLDKPILLLGRHPECDIQLDSRKVSRRHCCIAQVHDYLVVRDLGSTNGIRINGVRVIEGRLHGGDELTIGNHRYQVRWDTLASVKDRPHPAKPGKTDPDSPPLNPVPSEDDLILESCDEPVPLANDAGLPVSRLLQRSQPVPAPESREAAHVEAAPAKPVPAGDQALRGPVPSVLIPDDLRLAPDEDDRAQPGSSRRPPPQD